MAREEMARRESEQPFYAVLPPPPADDPAVPWAHGNEVVHDYDGESSR